MPKWNKYVIVAIGTFTVETKAYFAQSAEEAQKVKATAEAEHGVEFAVYRR